MRAPQSRARLSKRKEELEDILHELEMRIEEEEDLNNKFMDEKKIFTQNIKDLEDQSVACLLFFYSLLSTSLHIFWLLSVDSERNG